VETALQTLSTAQSDDMSLLQHVLSIVEATLNVLADSVLQEQPPIRRKKLEHLVSVNFSVVLIRALHFKHLLSI